MKGEDKNRSGFNDVMHDQNKASPSHDMVPSKRSRGSDAREKPLPDVLSSVTLDHALTNFDTDISPWKHPHDWNRANAIHVSSIMQRVKSFTGSDEIDKADLGANMIYPVSFNLSTFI